MKMRAKILNLIQSAREGRERDGKESGVFGVLRKAGNFQSKVSDLLEGTEAGIPKWWLAGEI